MPVERAGARDVLGLPIVLLIDDQRMRSFLRRTSREKSKPQSVRLAVGEAAERNGDLHRPAVGQDARLGAPDRVPLVEHVGVVLDQSLAARAERIDLEDVGVAARHVGIEIDPDDIVAVEPPSRCLMRAVIRSGWSS